MTLHPLSEWPVGRPAEVQAVRAPDDRAEWASQLTDLGFLPGEPVQLLHRAPLGGDPVVVRIGQSTFALRLAEAACVQVTGVLEAGRPEMGVRTPDARVAATPASEPPAAGTAVRP